MAGIGVYGVYYKKCVKNADGETTGYTGTRKIMGHAVSVSFEPTQPDDNPLWANNRVVESDAIGGSGGTITMTLDRLTLATAADLYGITPEEITQTIGENEIKGTGIAYTGAEMSAPVGVAYVKQHQMDNSRGHHELVFFREVTFQRPTDEAETMDGGTIEWQTPELTGTVAGIEGDGSGAWERHEMWPTLAAALARLDTLFGTDEETGGGTTSP